MKGGTNNCKKGTRRVCVPTNRKEEVVEYLKNNPKPRKNNQVPPELATFGELLKQVRRDNPGLSYRDAQKKASSIYKSGRPIVNNDSMSMDNSFSDRSFDTTSEGSEYIVSIGEDTDDELARILATNITRGIKPILKKTSLAQPYESMSILSEGSDLERALDAHDAKVVAVPVLVPTTIPGKSEVAIVPQIVPVEDSDGTIDSEAVLDWSDTELTIVEELAIKINAVDKLELLEKEIPDFKKKAQFADDIIGDFYAIDFDNEIDVKQAVRDLPIEESRRFFTFVTDIVIDVGTKFIDNYEKERENVSKDIQKYDSFDEADDFDYTKNAHFNWDTQEEEDSIGSIGFSNLSGEGFRSLKKAVRHLHRHRKNNKIRGGDSTALVSSDTGMSDYINNGYNGLVDILDRDVNYIKTHPNELNIDVAGSIYNTLLEFEDAYTTAEALIEQTRDNGYPSSFMCPLYMAYYEQLPNYIGDATEAFDHIKRQAPNIIKMLETREKDCGYKIYRDALGDPRGGSRSGSRGGSGRTYVPDYYATPRHRVIAQRY